MWAALLRSWAVASARRVGYHRRMIPRREAIMQLARLIGLEQFLERFGSPRTAEPEQEALTVLIEERLAAIASGLVGEAAASDDVIDATSAQAFLEDRLRTFSELIGEGQQGSLRASFAESTKDW